MRPIIVPDNYNYIGVFLTFACNLNCSYCINDYAQKPAKRRSIPGKEWVKGLNRIISRDDLPITLQGGEPSLHRNFLYLLNHIKPELNIDILTNLQFDIEEFMQQVEPSRIKRNSPYASIRVSYHQGEMDIDSLIKNTMKLQKNGYSIGIWSVIHPLYEGDIHETQEKCQKLGIDFRLKEFLGEYNDKLYGTYKFHDACDKKFKKRVRCRTTELLIDSEAKVYRCHRDLYAGENSIGDLLDPEFQIEEIYRPCENYGHCNPCDIKIKTNRFQIYGHTSVDIRFD